ncbi:MAG: hypothetical protein HGA45_06855 [Chloroflexales bacterium]|nr:hypothetical protein [Chloroflexales bacterium]
MTLMIVPAMMRITALLALLSLVACGAQAPAAVAVTASPAPMRTEPPAQATPLTSAAASPAVSWLALSPTPAPSIPTLTAAPTTPPRPPPATPAAPLSQLLPLVGPHALLYIDRGRYLTLLDLEQPRQPLWLNAGLCPGQPAAAVYGRWSGDGRFIAFVCQHYLRHAEAYLVSMQTGAVQQIGAAEIIDLDWSPVGSHLLVTEWSSGADGAPTARAYVLDAAQGSSANLPVAATFEMRGYAGVGPWKQVFGTYRALMAWAPDGAQLAIVGHDAVCVADAEGRNARTFPQASDPQLYHEGEWGDGGQFRDGPVWGADGQTISVVRLVGNARAVTPKGSIGSRAVQISIATGEARLVDVIQPSNLNSSMLPSKRFIDASSPDGMFLATVVLTPEVRYVVVGDGQGQERAALPGLTSFLGWRPAP